MKRPKRDRQIPLSELKVGDKHEGMVITVKEYGAYVDFGATRDGYVRIRVSSILSQASHLLIVPAHCVLNTHNYIRIFLMLILYWMLVK